MKTALERLRAVIRDKVEPRDHSRLFNLVDQIQQQVFHADFNYESVQSSIQQTRGTTRRYLRDKPVDMVQIIKALDGVEQEVVDLLTAVARQTENS